MRVAIVAFNARETEDRAIVSKLGALASAHGHSVDTFMDGVSPESVRLSLYDYSVVVTRPVGLSSRVLGGALSEFLASSGTLKDKKGCAIVLSRGLFSQRACREVMEAMEKQGMCVDYFEILRTEADVEKAGRNIG